jgi:hypothetical protein
MKIYHLRSDAVAWKSEKRQQVLHHSGAIQQVIEVGAALAAV